MTNRRWIWFQTRFQTEIQCTLLEGCLERARCETFFCYLFSCNHVVSVTNYYQLLNTNEIICALFPNLCRKCYVVPETNFNGRTQWCWYAQSNARKNESTKCILDYHILNMASVCVSGAICSFIYLKLIRDMWKTASTTRIIEHYRRVRWCAESVSHLNCVKMKSKSQCLRFGVSTRFVCLFVFLIEQ